MTGYRTAGTVQGFLQNEDLSFFQWPLRGALFPLKGLGIMNRQETRKLKQKVVLLCRRYRQKNFAVTYCALITCEVFVSLEITSAEQLISVLEEISGLQNVQGETDLI